MMVAGKLEARGRGTNDIRFILDEQRNDVSISDFYNETGTEVPVMSDNVPVRLVGGQTPLEGRLQVCWDIVVNSLFWNFQSCLIIMLLSLSYHYFVGEY